MSIRRPLQRFRYKGSCLEIENANFFCILRQMIDRILARYFIVINSPAISLFKSRVLSVSHHLQRLCYSLRPSSLNFFLFIFVDEFKHSILFFLSLFSLHVFLQLLDLLRLELSTATIVKPLLIVPTLEVWNTNFFFFFLSRLRGL